MLRSIGKLGILQYNILGNHIIHQLEKTDPTQMTSPLLQPTLKQISTPTWLVWFLYSI